MSENKHTPEPWRIELVNHALGDTGDYEGVVEIRAGDAKRPMIEIWSDSDEAEANARRIVACVNACAGSQTDALEEMQRRGLTFGQLAFLHARLQQQRDELLAALEKAREEMSCANFNSAAERIDHAIAIAKGEQP